MDMQSGVFKRSIMLRGQKTSVSLEDEFWQALKEIASQRRITATQLISEIDAKRAPGNLSSLLRVMVLTHYRRACGVEADQLVSRKFISGGAQKGVMNS